METNRKSVKAAVAALVVLLVIVMVVLFATLKHLEERSSDRSDREALLALKSSNYLDRTVEEFNRDFEPVKGLYNGFGRNEPEVEFMTALFHSVMELNAAENGEAPILYDIYFCGDFEYEYQLEWRVNGAEITVGKREDVLRQALFSSAIIFSSKSGDELRDENALALIQTELSTVAAGLSDEDITITLTLTEIVENKK